MKKENTTLGYAATSTYKNGNGGTTASRKNSKKVNYKKRFKKAVAKRLGVKYKTIKKLFPRCLNSTLTANYLDPYIAGFTHEEIRDICQGVKLEFEGV